MSRIASRCVAWIYFSCDGATQPASLAACSMWPPRELQGPVLGLTVARYNFWLVRVWVVVPTPAGHLCRILANLEAPLPTIRTQAV